MVPKSVFYTLYVRSPPFNCIKMAWAAGLGEDVLEKSGGLDPQDADDAVDDDPDTDGDLTQEEGHPHLLHLVEAAAVDAP